MQPRLIRLRDVTKYLGMDVHRFNREVRPFLTEIPIGKQGIAFDILDLDAWVEQYKACSGRPATMRSINLWDAKKSQASTNVMVTGMSTNESSALEFQEILEQIVSKKRKNT